MVADPEDECYDGATYDDENFDDEEYERDVEDQRYERA